jgi:hydroxyethylthiazole kinase-like uncharacterized protein yjeF
LALELLTPDEMAEADRLAIERGPFSGIELMRRAGEAVAAAVLKRFPEAREVAVLCGPGNNGGDGYVIAERLKRSGVSVAVYGDGPPREGSDAALAAAECSVWPQPLAAYQATPGTLVVDALFGAGLAREIEGTARRAIELTNEAGLPVVAVDLPSGISGATGRILGESFRAVLTVTFVRKKPGHLLLPGRQACGEILVADIGIGDEVISDVEPRCFENLPGLWLSTLPAPETDAHKYSRGHVAVFSGGAAATGAARLSAMAAARIGAGAVTVLSSAEALAANAAHLTSIMLRKADTPEEILAFAAERRPPALVYGPGLSPEAETGARLFQLLDAWPRPVSAVVDASALTSLAKEPDRLATPFGGRQDEIVITPHEGEFRRLFPDLSSGEIPSKVERAREAARRIDGVVIYKGPDTVIASPGGRAAINANGTPWLATAGSGDVLSGLIAGLLAQGMPAFEAAAAAVWIHAEAASRFGPSLIAEDLPLAILPVIRELLGQKGSWGYP